MKNIQFPIYLAAAILIAYTFISQFYPNPALLMGVYIIIPILVAWMIYDLMRDGIPAKESFDDHFYVSRHIDIHPHKDMAHKHAA